MRGIWQDIRLAFRILYRHTVYTAIAVGTLAVGIGAATAIFGVVSSSLLRPLPFPDDERLVRLYQVPRDGVSRISIRTPTYLAIEEEVGSFASLVGQRYMSLTMDGQDGPEPLVAIAVSQGWSATLAVAPVVGRGFSATEFQAGLDAGVVVISHQLWQQRLGARDDVLGTALSIEGAARQVVGVMPPGFRYPYGAEAWLPMAPEAGSGGTWAMNVQARLGPGIVLAQAQAELDAVARRLEERLPQSHQHYGLLAVPTREVLLGDQTRLLLALQAAVAVLLIIVCANVSSLLLARGVVRQREAVVRSVLGAGRWAQMRQLLVESMVVALLGGALGLALAVAGRAVLSGLLPERMATVDPTVAMDWRVGLFAFAGSLVAGVLSGLVPALRSSGRSAMTLLRSAGRTDLSGSDRALRAFVVGEVVLAVVLVVVGSLLVRTARNLAGADLGYERESLTSFIVSLERPQYESSETRIAFQRQLLERLEALPGVESASSTSILPVPGANHMARIEAEGQESLGQEPLVINNRFVGASYFETMGIPVLAGRGLEESDNASSEPVAVVGQALARRLWQEQDPLGRQLRSVGRDGTSEWLTVVGVVGDVREPRETTETWYLPYAQNAGHAFAVRLVCVVRTADGAAVSAEVLSRTVWSVDPALPLRELSAINERWLQELRPRRLGTDLVSGFAGAGLLLAALGVYGIMAFAVTRRTREIGVRMALGATRGAVARMVLAEGLRLAGLGVAVGVVCAVGAARLVSGLLVGVGASDPWVFVFAATTLLITTAAACLVPAHRAVRVAPAAALRHE